MSFHFHSNSHRNWDTCLGMSKFVIPIISFFQDTSIIDQGKEILGIKPDVMVQALAGVGERTCPTRLRNQSTCEFKDSLRCKQDLLGGLERKDAGDK